MDPIMTAGMATEMLGRILSSNSIIPQRIIIISETSGTYFLDTGYGGIITIITKHNTETCHQIVTLEVTRSNLKSTLFGYV